MDGAQFELGAWLTNQVVGNIVAIGGSPSFPSPAGTMHDVSYWSRVAGNNALSIIRPYRSRTKRSVLSSRSFKDD